MIAIRMTRHGAKKRPFFHIVVADSRSPRDGRFIEKLGTYNPLLPRDHAQRLTLDKERIAHWLKVGAQPSDRVARLLQRDGIKLPDWVKLAAQQSAKTRHPDKLRKNRPAAEETVAEAPVEAPAEPVAEVATEAPVEAPAEAPAE